MVPILPLDVTDVDGLQVRVIDESGWLASVNTAFVRHVMQDDTTQRCMDDRYQPLERSFGTLSPGNKEVRELSD
jgi:hypothetical protein